MGDKSLLDINSKIQYRELELNRVLQELETITGRKCIQNNNRFAIKENILIKSYCRSIIKRGDPKLEKRLYYALYIGKKGKLKNINIQTNRKLKSLLVPK